MFGARFCEHHLENSIVSDYASASLRRNINSTVIMNEIENQVTLFKCSEIHVSHDYIAKNKFNLKNLTTSEPLNKILSSLQFYSLTIYFGCSFQSCAFLITTLQFYLCQ